MGELKWHWNSFGDWMPIKIRFTLSDNKCTEDSLLSVWIELNEFRISPLDWFILRWKFHFYQLKFDWMEWKYPPLISFYKIQGPNLLERYPNLLILKNNKLLFSFFPDSTGFKIPFLSDQVRLNWIEKVHILIPPMSKKVQIFQFEISTSKRSKFSDNTPTKFYFCQLWFEEVKRSSFD